MITSEIIKDGVQYSRNMIENLQRNKDFLHPLINNKFDYKKYIREGQIGVDIDCNKNRRNCILYQNFTEETQELVYMKYIIANSIIMINYTLDTKLFQGPAFPVNKQFNYFFNPCKSLFVFPYSEINLNQTAIYNYQKTHSKITLQYYNYYFSNISIREIYNTINNSQFITKIVTSPFVSGINSSSFFDLFKEHSNNSYLGYQGVSMKYNDLMKPIDPTALTTYILDPGNIKDFISLESNLTSIDLYNFELTSSFIGTRVFLQTVNQVNNPSLLITPKTCGFYRFLYNISNPDPLFTLQGSNNYANILGCFLYSYGRETIESTFMNSTYDEYYIKRRVKIPLLNRVKDSSVDEAIYYKVFRSLTPDPYIFSIVNSDYFSIKQMDIFVLKNEEFMKKVNNKVFYNFVGVMFFILFFNFFFWYLLLLLIYILLFKVSNSLTKPINLLSKLIKSIGKEESEEVKDAWNFAYSEDKDIKELFDLCKNLIKGGFSDSSRSKDKKNEKLLLNSAYNNISYVKTNNIIIEEEKIEKSSNFSAETIFNYKRNFNIENNNIPNHLKEENIYSDPSKDTGFSLRENSGSMMSRKTRQKIKFKTKTEFEVFQSVEELQKKEEKDFLLFDYFKNTDLRICSFEKDY